MTDAEKDRMADETRNPVHGWSSVEEFRSFVAGRLGKRWSVTIDGVMPDSDEGGEIMSVAAMASSPDDVKVHVTHDRGVDVVFLSLRDEPPVPFEDLAVAKGKIDIGDLMELGRKALEEPPGETAFSLETTLQLICVWDGELAGDLNPENHTMAQKLKQISKEFELFMRLDS